jgi:hypothetical protein
MFDRTKKPSSSVVPPQTESWFGTSSWSQQPEEPQSEGLPRQPQLENAQSPSKPTAEDLLKKLAKAAGAGEQSQPGVEQSSLNDQHESEITNEGNESVDLGEKTKAASDQKETTLSNSVTTVARGARRSPKDYNMFTRSLSSEEIEYLKVIFRDSIDYTKVQITRHNDLSRGASKTIGNTIHLEDYWGGEAVFQTNNRSLTKTGIILLSHEITHVWQFQNGGWAYAPESLKAQSSAFLSGGDRNKAYRWQDAYDARLPWEQWNPEQQARAIEVYTESREILNGGKEGDRVLAQANREKLQPYVEKVRNRQGAPSYNNFNQHLSPRYWPSVP